MTTTQTAAADRLDDDRATGAADPGPADTRADGPTDGRVADAERKRAAKAAQRLLLGPIAGPLALASAVQFVASLAAVAPFVLVVELARELLGGAPDEGRSWLLAVWALVLLGVRGLLSASALFLSHLTDAGYQFSLRERLARRLSRVPLGWFGEQSSGVVKKSLQDDVHALHYLIAHARLDLVSAVTVPVVSLAYLMWVDCRLGVVLLLPLLGYLAAYARMMGGQNAGMMDRYTAWQQKVDASVVEFVDGIQVVRTFGQAGRAHRRFQEAVDGFSAFFAAWATPMTRLEAAVNVLLNPAFLLLVVMAAGTGMVGLGWVEPIALLPFVMVGLGLGATILTLGYAAQASKQASDAALRLSELLSTPELRVTPHPVAPVEHAETAVAFEGVSFEYRPGRPVLRDLSFAVRAGTITALVGPSGSGKSTLAKLLPRFYDATAGAVSVNGADVRDLDPDVLYRMVGFVFQDVRLVRGTIRQNIALGRPGATDEQVEAAARAAQLHDRILQLPAGYDAEIGVDVRLSGGEAQRLSIARALLADPPILVLDEATAFADPESEAAIQDALARLVAGRTVLVIAHRLHTIVDVDTILVLEGGRLVEQGTHPELLAADGLYRRLWDADEAATTALADEEDAR